MNKLLVAALWALACSANAIYHFHLNLPDPCDILVDMVVLSGTTKTVEVARLHGGFIHVRGNTTTPGAPVTETAQLIRPDYAAPGKEAKAYAWGQGYCDSVQEEQRFDLFSLVDLYFTNKEAAVFHGIKCTAMYNVTESGILRFYVNEETGTLYGATTRDVDCTYKFSKATDNSPKKFTFDKKTQANCEGDAFVPPRLAAYTTACKRTNASFNILRPFATKH